MKYTSRSRRKRLPKRLLTVTVVSLMVIVAATVVVRHVYDSDVKPLSSSEKGQTVVIKDGETTDQIAAALQNMHLIRSAWAFSLYVKAQDATDSVLQAGTYNIAPNQSVSQIAQEIAQGRVITNLVTILPGQRIDQVKTRLVESGFSEAAVDQALNPAIYAGNPALVGKPANASLEGYIYPQSYQKTDTTTPEVIITAALQQMNDHLTPTILAAFAKQGLSTYQAITLASIVGQEVSTQSDRDQVAQVFLKRLRTNMPLQSDATTEYGAILAGATPSTNYPSAYNTYQHTGLPPSPISNVDVSSLEAVAYPSNTNWLYFVSGDNGVTHFAQTLAQQQTNIAQYCTKLCTQ